MLTLLPHLARAASRPTRSSTRSARSSGPLVDLLRGILRAIHDVIGSWGWAIIILTIIVRLILMPLTFKQFRSAQSMQQLQPKIKELQRKYKADKRKLQEETMKLYQEYRVNPFASCLPLLLQMPIFISLYYAIRFTPEISTSSFWIIPSLGLRYLPLFVALHRLADRLDRAHDAARDRKAAEVPHAGACRSCSSSSCSGSPPASCCTG